MGARGMEMKQFSVKMSKQKMIDKIGQYTSLPALLLKKEPWEFVTQ